jgi:hypothetical protein
MIVTPCTEDRARTRWNPWGAKASGGPGAGVIHAHNDERNAVSCGTGSDTISFDGELDALATDCGKHIPRQFEPPLNVPLDD